MSYTKNWEVTSDFEQKLAEVQRKLDETKEERVNELVTQANEVQELTQLDQYDLSDRDKRNYMYLVKPQLHTIKTMIEAGMTSAQIADALTVSHAALMRMRKEVPELEEIFYIGKLSKVEMAEESIFQLARENIIEEQMLTRDGDVVTIQKKVLPQFQAAKFIVENHMPDQYSSKNVVVHQADYGNGMKELLETLDEKTLAEILAASDAIDITDETEVRDADK